MAQECSDTRTILRRAHEGDAAALDALFARHQGRLERMVKLRLHPRLLGRVDHRDILRVVRREASRRLPDYLKAPGESLFLWLRSLTGEKLADVHRGCLGAPAAETRWQVFLGRASLPQVTSAVLAAQLIGTTGSPGREFVRAEKSMRLQHALAGMDVNDRAVLILRHFEHLTNAEAARELGVGEPEASRGYIRALLKLRQILASVEGGISDFRKE